MSILKIFGDEAGTMPLSDSDGPFVAGIFGVFDKIPQYEKADGRKQWLVEQLQKLFAVPAIAYVQPFEGYSKILEEKLSKIHTMSRATRLMTKANIKFVRADDIAARNFIWTQCMDQAIAKVILHAISLQRIKYIDITLDQKTMTPESRNLFLYTASTTERHVRNAVRRGRHIFPEISAYLEDNLAFSENDISVSWGDVSPGLKLAHYLASHFKNDLIKRPKNRMEHTLYKAGFRNITIDITPILLQPISQKTISTWEQNTGLREPKA